MDCSAKVTSEIKRRVKILNLVFAILVPLHHAKAEPVAATPDLKAAADQRMAAEDYPGAITAYDKAIKMDSKDPLLFLGRALAKNLSEDYSGAVEDSSKAIELDPKCAEAYFARGSAKRSLKNDKGSISDFTEAIKLRPADYLLQIRALSGRAGAKSALGDLVGAIADYDSVLKLDSKRAVSYYLRATAKIRNGDKNGALSDYSKAGDLGFSQAYDAIKQVREMSP